MPRRSACALAIFALSVALVGCAERITTPLRRAIAGSARRDSAGATMTWSAPADTGVYPPSTDSVVGAPSVLMVCPNAVGDSVMGVIGPGGGRLALRGTSIDLPAGAVADTQTFVLVLPVSRYMKVDIYAAGHEHFAFQAPAHVAINFARCSASAMPTKRLQTVWVDPATDSILAVMEVGADRALKHASFDTPHLSGYVIAY